MFHRVVDQVHQGLLERGSKTGSFSYLLWPSRVGAFTAVIGKHYANFDASDLPFSYITEEDAGSVITPAMNFFTVGTMRDVGLKFGRWLDVVFMQRPLGAGAAPLSPSIAPAP